MKLFKENKVLAKDVVIYNGILEKAIGLRFKEARKSSAYIFPIKSNMLNVIDTFFVFFELDIIFLDKDFNVIGLRKKVWPFNFLVPEKNTRFIVEMKNAGKINVGDSLKLA